MTIGDEGRIARLSKEWREFEPYAEVPIITPQQAFEYLKAQKEQTLVPLEIIEYQEVVIVKTIYLRYWREPSHNKQEYVQPVYTFQGYYDDEYQSPATFWVNAIP